MHISRVVVRNFRNLKHVDFPLTSAVNCIIGENNSGKSNLLTAIRLCLDAGLSSSYRRLSPTDIHTAVPQKSPFQVLIGVEIVDYADDLNQLALLHSCQLGANRARLFYRFRPRKFVRDALESGDRACDSLQPDDYSWEILGGGDPDIDLADIEWNEDLGQSVSLADLQHFQVVTLHALRDVESDLRNSRASPLVKLLEAADIPDEERAAFIATLSAANSEISASESLQQTVKRIQNSLAKATGSSYGIGIGLGIGTPTYQSVLRSLRVLLSEKDGAQEVDPSRNGLGLNNVLYIAIWLEYLSKRVARETTAGQLILIEEPEAHLHPQLQMTLMAALERLSFQSLVTTHSTHVTSRMPIDANVVLGPRSGGVVAHAVATNATLLDGDRRDLERFLDATKSTLLFARRVLLVEGAAELLLLPKLIEELMEVDLERHGVALVSINGTHFAPFLRLFAGGDLGKRCAVVMDGDATPDEVDDDGETAREARADLRALECAAVKLFVGRTTFERDIAFVENSEMIVSAAFDSGLHAASRKLATLAARARRLEDDDVERIQLQRAFQDGTLRVARRIGKGRFAQLCSKQVTGAYLLPEYISDAVDWLLDE